MSDERRNAAAVGRATEGADLYEIDHVAWIEQQVAHLRNRRFDELDLPNLIDEVEELARSQRREIASRLVVLIAELLEARAHAGRMTRKSRMTILEQRQAIAIFTDDSPTLLREMPLKITAAYPHAVKRAMIVTDLPRSEFPSSVPFTAEEILADTDEY